MQHQLVAALLDGDLFGILGLANHRFQSATAEVAGTGFGRQLVHRLHDGQSCLRSRTVTRPYRARPRNRRRLFHLLSEGLLEGV